MLLQFTKRIIIFATIVSVIAALLFLFLIPEFYLPVFPFLMLFFIAVSISVHAILTRAGSQRIRRFQTFFMGSVTVKLFIYIIFIITYILIDKKSAIPFLITFFILYVLFTVFETWSLINDLKNQTPVSS